MLLSVLRAFRRLRCEGWKSFRVFQDMFRGGGFRVVIAFRSVSKSFREVPGSLREVCENVKKVIHGFHSVTP